MSDEQKLIVVYDGECPFCSTYVKLLRLQAAAGNVVLINARDDHPVVRYVKERGVVLDEEMALVIGETVYAGSECINRLALMSTQSGVFNRINAALFSSAKVSKFAYPFLRCGRNFALKALGRSPIEPQRR